MQRREILKFKLLITNKINNVCLWQLRVFLMFTLRRGGDTKHFQRLKNKRIENET